MNRILLYINILFILSACVSVKKIEIEVASPPNKPINDTIQSILLMNGSLTADFKNYDRDSLEAMLVKKDLVLDTILLDSIASDTIMQVAGKLMFESGRFDIVIPVERNIDHTGMPGHSKRKLTPEEVDQLCKDFNTDALLVLDNFSEKIKTTFGLKYAPGIYGDLDGPQEFKGEIEISYKSDWFLLLPNQSKHYQRFEINDTIFWEAANPLAQEMYNALPSIKEALLGGGIAVGESFAKQVSPLWRKDVRNYFMTGDKEADTAVPLIEKNKWAEAAEIWTKFLNATSTSMRSKIEHNLALAAEMTGDINKAIEWGIKSYHTKYSKETDQYLRILDKRRKVIETSNK